MVAPRRDRVYYFETPAGEVEIQQSIDFLYSPVEMNGIPGDPRKGLLPEPGIIEMRRSEPGLITIPYVLTADSPGRGKAMSSSIMIREYFRKRRAGDYGYKLYAMWRTLCKVAGYKVPSYNWFRLLLYRLKRLQLIRATSPSPHTWKPGTTTTVVPMPAANKTMFAVTRFGLGAYEYLGTDTEGTTVKVDAIDRMWRDPQAALYAPTREMRQAAAKYLVPADIANIGWP